ncbi:hypothetical protein NPX13_g7646 [Xylaria arbuscula]|uniref:Rhodopsin domain-containing protein n=1 Tax=Xylaria arbuscula TaxID=114810 RepID=A0A9W8NA53_9PEZI|nr:hypothetical protein NPX13_g7646 [Xylaria arbuscula]
MPGAVSSTPDQDSRVPNIIACGVITFASATIFVALRLWSRKIARGRLALDVSDWFAVAAWLYIVQENLYAATVACLKFSILSLYRNIFKSSLVFYRLTWVVSALVTEWFLQVVLSTNLQCIPLSASWDSSVKGTCINYGTEALAAYLINISTDILILSMPIPLVLKLHTSKAQKRRLIISFAAGGSACIVSLVQLAYITKLGNAPDSSWTIVPTFLLGDVELMIGFLATSIATYRPLYRFIFVEAPGTTPERLEDSNFIPYRGIHARNYTGGDTLVGANNPSGDGNIPESRRGIVITSHIELTRHKHTQGGWMKVNDDPSA